MKSIVFVAGLLALAGTALGNGTESGLIVLNETAEGALRMTGTSKIHITGHAVYVNSSHGQAVRTSGTAILDVPALHIVGGYHFTGNSHCTCGEENIITGGAPWENKKAHPTFPTSEGMPDYGTVSISGSATEVLEPGYYSGGLTIEGSGELTFEPGVYLFGGTGLKITGSRNITGYGVSLVVKEGTLDIAGSAAFELTPPEDGNLKGTVMGQVPTNTSPMHLSGTSGMEIRGMIYGSGAMLTMTGTSLVEGEGPLMGDLVIADMVELTGTSTIRIGGDDASAIYLYRMPLFD